MKHKTSELTGALLDAAVAKVEGVPVRYNVPDDFCVRYQGGDGTGLKEQRGPMYRPSTAWILGGPIIEHEEISVTAPMDGPEGWKASPPGPGASQRGTTPLIAAMRAYVASKLGNEVEL